MVYPGIMSRASFVIAFDGPGVESHAIDVRDLAPALMSVGKAVDAANIALHGESKPVRVEAKALSEGSFEVSLEVVIPLWEGIRGILTSDDANAATNLIAFLGFKGALFAGVIHVARRLGGRKPDRIEKSDDGASVTIRIDDESIIVPIEVLRLYQTIAVGRALRELAETIREGGVESVEFRPAPRKPADEMLTLEDKERMLFPEPEDQVVIDSTHEMALSIRSLAFQDGRKWRLYDGQNVITALIEDEDFISRVDSNEIRFAKSDVLRCQVRTVQRHGVDGLRTEYSVLRVIRHIPAPTQINLFKEIQADEDEPPLLTEED